MTDYSTLKGCGVTSGCRNRHLTVAPVRLANLTAIWLGINLIKPGGPASNYWLVFPAIFSQIVIEHLDDNSEAAE